MKNRKPLCVALCVCVQIVSVTTAHAGSYRSAHWEEADNRIKLNTVCDNYQYGSIHSRECRAEASKYFIKQCKAYTQKHSAASGSQRSRYKKSKTKYCYAARRFKIVN